MIPLSSIDYTQLTDAAGRNHFIGELIGAEPLEELHLLLDGKFLWPIRKPKSQWPEVPKWFEDWQSSEKRWQTFIKGMPDFKAEWRGRITTEIYRWHLRYSDTPAGGWAVIEHLREHHCSYLSLVTIDSGWELYTIPKGPGEHAIRAATVQEAACLMAVKLIKPAA